MKRVRTIACLTALIVTISSVFAFGAENLKIVESYPKDAQKNTTVENMSVKLTFNNPVDAEKNQKANTKCFTIKDEDGNKLPLRVFYIPDKSKKVLVLVDMTSDKMAANNKNHKGIKIHDNQKYTLTVSKDLVDNDGNKLGKDEKITFTTINQKWNTKIYMILMAVMMAAMFFFTSRQAKKQAAENNPNAKKDEPFNPYKEAKRTGKSLEEVMAQHEKEVAKLEAKQAREAKKAAKEEAEIEKLMAEQEEAEKGINHYKVSGPAPISKGGAKYKTGRKAKAEARKAEEERLAKRRAANKKKKKK